MMRNHSNRKFLSSVQVTMPIFQVLLLADDEHKVVEIRKESISMS